MKNFFTKNKKYIGPILIAAVVLNFALPKPAHAGPISWLASSAVLGAANVISVLLSAVFGIVLSIEAEIIDYILSPSNFSFTHSAIVTLGWSITRDLGNMFLIVILLVIAFSTVLRISSYGIKQLWWKVLVAALLVNFSLVIAGFILDFTQVLTTFFIKQAIGNGTASITVRLVNDMKITNFYQPSSSAGLPGFWDFGASSLAAVTGIFLTIGGLVVTVFTFGAAAIFLVVRIIWIWILLIFAPIVWMLWILPATRSQFSKWWNRFIQWSFFAPIYAFMLYLSLSIFDASGKLSNTVFWGIFPAGWNAAAGGLTQATVPSAIFQWLVLIGLMFASLIVAQKFGVEGAAGATKMLKGWGTKATNWTGAQLRRQALGIGARAAGPETAARAGSIVRAAQKIAGYKIPGSKLLANQLFNLQASEAKTVEAAQKQFAGWTSNGIEQYLKRSPGRISNALFRNQQVGAALALKEKGDLENLGEGRIKELAATASQMYSKKELKEILKVAPHLAPEFNENIKKIVASADKPDDMLINSLRDIKVVAELNPQQLQTIVQKAGSEKIDALKNTIDNRYNTLMNEKGGADALNKETREMIKQKVMGENLGPGERAPSRETRNQALRELAEQMRGGPFEDAEKIIRAKFVTRAPAWQT